jgi:DNA-binding MarR family transcriptional regulator
MKLEDEINTGMPFESERLKALVNLVYTYNFFLDKTLKALAEFDINDQHYNILKILSVQSPRPVSVGEIKNLLFNKRGDLTRLLDKLSDMNLVVREVNAENRRVVYVTISDLGKERLAQMDHNLETQRDSGSNISELAATQLKALLDQLRG